MGETEPVLGADRRLTYKSFPRATVSRQQNEGGTVETVGGSTHSPGSPGRRWSSVCGDQHLRGQYEIHVQAGRHPGEQRAIGYTETLKVTGTNGNRAGVQSIISAKIYGLVEDGKDFPTCSLAEIANAKNDTVCPKGAEVATGFITASLGSATNFKVAGMAVRSSNTPRTSFSYRALTGRVRSHAPSQVLEVTRLLGDFASTIAQSPAAENPPFFGYKDCIIPSPNDAALFRRAFSRRAAALLGSFDQWQLSRGKIRESSGKCAHVGIGVYLVNKAAPRRDPTGPSITPTRSRRASK